MAHLHKSVASLRISGDDLVPTEISNLLGCLPTLCQLKGEPIIGKKSEQIRIARFGMWRLLAKPCEPEDLDGQIADILSQLTDDLEVWNGLAERYSIDLFCGLFMGSDNEGLLISPASLLLLGERGVKLGLDIYGPD
ncbi:DUF4279 domain-containing protein [Burkholderia sp. 22PA0106]|uniref:DUF4279 domain-containing protein n=1 Tax=Burkholderia sp. 22PA0106 TaxID=3237371 RepID=UPI0039C20E02